MIMRIGDVRRRGVHGERGSAMRSWNARSLMCVLVLASVLTVLMATAGSAATTATEHQLTTAAFGQWNPRVSGATVVWNDMRTSFNNVYAYDVVSGVETPITNSNFAQGVCDVSGDVIVWQDNRNINYDIYAYDLASGQEKRLTTHSSNQTDPSISGDTVVWVDDRNSNDDIYALNLATGVETRITTNSSAQQEPCVSGDTVVWTDYRHGLADVYLYDLATGQEKRLTTEPQTQDNPSVYGDTVVWQDSRSGTYQIYGYDLRTGTTTRLDPQSADQYYPAVSHDRVVWDDRRGVGSPDVYGFDLNTGEEIEVCVRSVEQSDPAIWGDKVVWEDARDGNYNIYMADYPAKMTRVQGSNRFGTAVSVSKNHPTFGASVAILATARDFPDALSASGLAGAYRAPLLLVDTDSVPGSVMSELDRKDIGRVILVGGTSAITNNVRDALVKAGYPVERISGATRYETSQVVAQRIKSIMGSRFAKTAIVARGDDFADALAASPVAYSQKLPVLLTKPTSLPSATRSALEDLDVETAVVTGGTAAVSASVKSAVDSVLKSNGGTASARWAGSDRYATCTEIAEGAIAHKWVGPGFVGIATGLDFPDALCGGAACGEEYGVLLLSKPGALPGSAQAFIADYRDGIGVMEAFGGTAVLSDSVLTSARTIANQ